MRWLSQFRCGRLLLAMCLCAAEPARAGLVEIDFSGTITSVTPGAEFLPAPPTVGDHFTGHGSFESPLGTAVPDADGVATYGVHSDPPFEISFGGMRIGSSLTVRITDDDTSGTACAAPCDRWALSVPGDDPAFDPDSSSPDRNFYTTAILFTDDSGTKVDGPDFFAPASLEGWSAHLSVLVQHGVFPQAIISLPIGASIDSWHVVPEPESLAALALAALAVVSRRLSR